MVQLIIYAVLALGLIAGAIGAWHSFRTWVAAPLVAAQIAQDQKAVDAAGKRATEAEAQASAARADTAACVQTSSAQSEQVQRWQDEAAKRLADAARARAESAAANQAARTAIARYEHIVALPPAKDQTCEQQLEATDRLLREAATERAKGGR